MARKQTEAQKATIERVMHEFKEGELRTRGNGPMVSDRKQAIAIALHEAGGSKAESQARNRETLRKPKSKEEVAGRSGGGKTRAELYREAQRREIPGRSQMDKAALERALAR